VPTPTTGASTTLAPPPYSSNGSKSRSSTPQLGGESSGGQSKNGNILLPCLYCGRPVSEIRRERSLIAKRADRIHLNRSLRTGMHLIWPDAWGSMEALAGLLGQQPLETENPGQFRSSSIRLSTPNRSRIMPLRRMGSERSASSVYLDNDSDAGSDGSGPTSYSAAAGSSSATPKSNRGPGRRE
jgi:hypothetical protein